MEILKRIMNKIVMYLEIVAEARARHIRESGRYRGYY